MAISFKLYQINFPPKFSIQYDYNAADPDLPPEVQFERDVFFGAEKVRFYYELKVHRENLLKMGPG
jgi:hypothetical protein